LRLTTSRDRNEPRPQRAATATSRNRNEPQPQRAATATSRDRKGAEAPNNAIADLELPPCNRFIYSVITCYALKSNEQKPKLQPSRQASVAKLIRTAVDALVEREAGESREELAARAKRTFGKFDSGLQDVSRNHDKYLAEAYSERG
jgi:hypothetical protein